MVSLNECFNDYYLLLFVGFNYYLSINFNWECSYIHFVFSIFIRLSEKEGLVGLNVGCSTIKTFVIYSYRLFCLLIVINGWLVRSSM